MIDWLAGCVTPLRGLAASLLVAVLLAGCGGSLLLLARRLAPRPPRRHPADALLIALGLGVAVGSLVPRLLASEGSGPGPWTGSWVLLVALGTPGLVAGLSALRRLAGARRVLSWPAVLVAAAAGAPTLAGALCAPIGWDELAYHAELPRRWLEAGRPGTFLDNPYSAFPGGSEILATFALQLGGFTAPRALTWIAWVALVVAAYRLARPALRPAHAAALAFAFAWMPVVLMTVAEAYVEPWLALQLAALLLLLRRGPAGAATALAAGGLSAGAAALKLTGLVLPLLAWIAMPSRPKGRARWALPLLAAAVGAMGLMAYGDAFLVTGTPTFPYYARAFTPEDAALVASSDLHHALGGGYGRPGALGALANVVEIAWGGGRTSGRLGAQWLVLLALGLAGCARRAGRRALLAAACGWIFWTLTTQQARFLLPTLVLALVAAASGLATLPRRGRHVIAGLLVVTALASTSRARWMHFWSTAQAAYGVGAAPSVQDYLHTGLGDAHLLACRAVHDLTPEDARVLLLFDSRALYVPREREIGTPLWQPKWFAEAGARRDPGRVLSELRRGRMTHVLEGAPRRDPDAVPELRGPREELRATLRRLEAAGHLTLLWEHEGFRLLQVAPRNGVGSRFGGARNDSRPHFAPGSDPAAAGPEQGVELQREAHVEAVLDDPAGERRRVEDARHRLEEDRAGEVAQAR